MGDLEEALQGQRLTHLKSRRYSDSAIGRRSVRRPEEISRDVRGLKARRRVSLVLEDEILREDLEDMTRGFVGKNGSSRPTIRTYEDFLVPTIFPGVNRSSDSGRVLPINDLRGDNSLRYTKTEKNLRCKLASFYRLIDYYNWGFLVYNHVTVRLPGENKGFLIKPLGLLDCEVTASSLTSLDLNSNVLDQGSTCLDVNMAGFLIHGAIYEDRPEVKCIAHIHYPAIQAVSAMKCGMLRINQESLSLGKISYMDFDKLFVTEEEKADLKASFPKDSKVLMMRNHGIVVVGDSVEEVFRLLYLAVEVCETQVKLMPVGLENIIILSEDKVEINAEALQAEKVGLGDKAVMAPEKMEWEALMRKLDAMGYCTGYIYHIPDVFICEGNTKKIPESQIPPTATSLTAQSRKTPFDLLYEIERGNPVQRSASVSRANTYRNRIKWLNSPVMATQYKQEKEVPPAKLEPKVKQEAPVQNGVKNDEPSDIIDKEERVAPTTIVTDVEAETPKKAPESTTIVTETTVKSTKPDNSQSPSKSNFVKMVAHKTVEVVDGKEVVVDDTHVFVNGTTNGDDLVVIEGENAPKSPGGATGGASENGSDVDDKDLLAGKSPKKVKKQKSFKNFMKKVGKK